jgi:hypothetical protein
MFDKWGLAVLTTTIIVYILVFIVPENFVLIVGILGFNACVIVAITSLYMKGKRRKNAKDQDQTK